MEWRLLQSLGPHYLMECACLPTMTIPTRFKPAPLYILDEVDAALDLNHTQNIGAMIKQHFPQSQFVVVSACAPLEPGSPTVHALPSASAAMSAPLLLWAGWLSNEGFSKQPRLTDPCPHPCPQVSLKEGMFNNANVIFRTKFVDGVSTVTRTVPNHTMGAENAKGARAGSKQAAAGGAGAPRAALREANRA